MQFEKLPVNERANAIYDSSELVLNRLVRKYDAIKESVHLKGRKAPYDDANFEFIGGAGESLQRKHYDKSLRLLWKAESHAPWLGFRDASKIEKVESDLRSMAAKSMSPEEKAENERITMPQFKELLNREYTEREKEAIVSILAAIAHGEAYAWLVSAEMLALVKSTGARTALTMQVLEEAKHFVVLRNLLRAFDVKIPRQSAWEYILLERVYKSKGLEKFFGMNVVVEGIGLSLFGLMSHLPGLDILRLFHLDEARHSALPVNYLKEFPMTDWQKQSPMRRMHRLGTILPALMLIPQLERDLAEVGVDVFEFGGSVIRKITTLSHRAGFLLPLSPDGLMNLLEKSFNVYANATRENHEYTAYMSADTTVGLRERAVEQEILGIGKPTDQTPTAKAKGKTNAKAKAKSKANARAKAKAKAKATAKVATA